MVNDYALIALEIEKSLLLGIVLLFFMPWIVFLIVRIISRVVSWFTGIDPSHVRSFLNFIFIPFVLIRMTLFYVTLGLLGWETRVGAYSRRRVDHYKVSDSFSYGFNIGFAMYPPHRVTLREIIIIFLVPYLMTALYLIFVLPSEILPLYLQYLFGTRWAFWAYWYLTIGMLLGWVKIPDSSMVILQYLIVHFPHVLVAILLNALSSILLYFLVSPVSIYGDNPLPIGSVLASTWFLLWTAIVIYRSLLNQEILSAYDNNDIQIIQDYIMENGIY